MRRLLARALIGMVAGLGATGVMSLCMLGAKRIGALGEPPPRRITRRLLSPLAPGNAAVNVSALVAHFAFGASMGGLFGLLLTRLRSSGAGVLFGLGVWAVNYAGVLPKVGLMPRPSRDRVGRPSAMVLSHAVFGASLAALHRELSSTDGALRGKVAVVCGGSRGLGRAIARELVQRGAKVAICARSSEQLEQTRAWLESFGAPVLAEVCDLRREDETRRFFERIARELGAVDVLVANAATITVAPIETLTPSDFDDALSEIFGTAARAVLAALPDMRVRRQGTIVFITSIGGKVGVPHLAPYSAAKFAVVGFAEALEAEVAKDNVRVLTVMPGLMRTGSHLHATFRGRPEQEFGWFGASAITPILAIDADRAARHVVRAIARGDRRLVFTIPARIAARLHDLAPAAWSSLAALAGRLLPKGPDYAPTLDEREGSTVAEASSSRIIQLIGKRSAGLAERHGQ